MALNWQAYCGALQVIICQIHRLSVEYTAEDLGSYDGYKHTVLCCYTSSG